MEFVLLASNIANHITAPLHPTVVPAARERLFQIWNEMSMAAWESATMSLYDFLTYKRSTPTGSTLSMYTDPTTQSKDHYLVFVRLTQDSNGIKIVFLLVKFW